MKRTIFALLVSGAAVLFTATDASAQTTFRSNFLNPSSVRYWTYQPGNYTRWDLPSNRYYAGYRNAYYGSPNWRYNWYRYPSYYRYSYPYSTYYRYYPYSSYYRYPYSSYYRRYTTPYYRYPSAYRGYYYLR